MRGRWLVVLLAAGALVVTPWLVQRRPAAADWRLDRIRSTGETDLFRRGDTSIRWVLSPKRRRSLRCH